MEDMSPLIKYALKGLENCWMTDRDCWAHAFQPGAKERLVSIPQSDVFYSLNVLLGLSRLKEPRKQIIWKNKELFSSLCIKMLSLPVRAYAYGMALWAGAELGWPLPDETVNRIDQMMRRDQEWTKWKAQDVGMLLSGLSKMVEKQDNRWKKYTLRLKIFANEYLSSTGTGLFFDCAKGFRRQFSTFATHVYLTLGYFHYGEAFQDEFSIQRALVCVEALGNLQGEKGEWPWFYHSPSARVMEKYPVYSVHQDGMAPAYLRKAMIHGHPTAHKQLVKGFNWIFGNNELKQSMLMPKFGIILRSQMRNETHERYKRAFRSIKNWVSNEKHGNSIQKDKLRINNECRSYHLGWILYSFADQSDFSELTCHNDFKAI